MNTKLTLRMDEDLISKAKVEARRRGKSVSQMAAEFFASLNRSNPPESEALPITRSLRGALKKSRLSERDHKRHLKEKYL